MSTRLEFYEAAYLVETLEDLLRHHCHDQWAYEAIEIHEDGDGNVKITAVPKTFLTGDAL
jgi:hypothetical protein